MSRGGLRLPSLALAYEEKLFGATFAASEPHRQRPLVLALEATAPSLSSLVTTRRIALEGELHAAGIAERARVDGAVELRWLEERVAAIAYRLVFESDDGARLSLELDKRFDGRHPYAAFTVATGAIRDERGAVRAECIARFDARSDLRAHLRSLRLRLVHS